MTCGARGEGEALIKTGCGINSRAGGAEGERRSSEPPKLWRELLRENRASSEIFGHDLTWLHLTVAIRDAPWYHFCSFFALFESEGGQTHGKGAILKRPFLKN